MDFFSHIETTSSRGCSLQNLQFHTAPSSLAPLEVGSGSDDDFEYETTRRITNCCEFQQSYSSFGWMKRYNNEPQTYKLPARAKSFCSGQVLLLKLPPRLQTSVSTSPRSPNSLLRFPFARPCTWNDDFDPFQFALEKVSEETRARMSFHRRSHSYSPYRTNAVAHWLDGSVDSNKEHHKQGLNPNRHLKPRGPTLAKMIERRESVYSRRITNEPTVKPRSKSSRMVRTKTKDADDEPMKTRSDSSSCTESKVQRMISLSMKKASKTSWKLRRCLGYARRSPPFMK